MARAGTFPTFVVRLAFAALILLGAMVSAAGAVFATTRGPHVTPGTDCTARHHPSA
ncbi:hypothetical protein [Sphaerisporangium rubeum]|uniref:Uncharacterized protein n=1 Tax=Sphaerisporangium rubeum TaxID=321317 RepID=A0A7X0IDE1_9ACTN|nr:hypothetical protein [Sphaerisporangium rubeum]MBB6471928.1 hypothetical protein [Sphaerisporangium rubeum]